MTLLNKSWFAVARTILKRDEGSNALPYRDTLGNWTIGVGHLIGSDLEHLILNERAIDALLDDDIATAWQSVINIFGETALNNWLPARQHAVLNLAFNLGETRLRKFHKAIEAIQSEDWNRAAEELKDSLWATQVRTRSDRVCFMIQTGLYHDAYRLDS